MKILVVDDSKAMRMIVIKTLKQAELGSLKNRSGRFRCGSTGSDQIRSARPDPF